MTILYGQTASTTIPTLLSAIRETIVLKKYKHVKNISFAVIIDARIETHTHTHLTVVLRVSMQAAVIR